MHSIALFQTALVASVALLANAMPLETRDGSNNKLEPIVHCGDLDKKNGWSNDLPSWMSSAPSGDAFCSSQWDSGNRVLGLAAFKLGPACGNKGPISRLEVRYSNGHVDNIGGTDKTCDAGSIGIAADEVFTYIGSQPAGDLIDGMQSQGKIHIKTTQGGQLKHETWLKDEYNPGAALWEPSTGSGVLIAVTGVVDRGIIKQLNFHFTSSPITKITRDNMQYDMNDLNKVHINTFYVEGMTFANLQHSNGSFKYESHKGYAQSLSTSTSTTMTLGVKISVEEKVGIPDIIDVTAKQEFDWETTTTTAHSATEEQKQDVTWTYTGVVTPGTATDCIVSGGKASGDIPFKSTVTLFFDDGSKYRYTETGELNANQIVAEHGLVSCQDRPATAADAKYQVIV